MDSEDRKISIIAIVVAIVVVTFIVALAHNDRVNQQIMQTCLQHNTAKECADAKTR